MPPKVRSPDGAGYLLGELDIVKDDEWALDVEHCSVINARSNVVVALGGLDVYLCD